MRYLAIIRNNTFFYPSLLGFFLCSWNISNFQISNIFSFKESTISM